MTEPSLLSQLRMQDVEAPEGQWAVALPLRPQLLNPRSALQGGFIATLVDVAGGKLAFRLAGPEKTVPTADLNLRFLAPITEGPAVATARLLRHGRTTIVVQVDVRDAGRDVLAATATLAFSILVKRPGQDVVLPAVPAPSA